MLAFELLKEMLAHKAATRTYVMDSTNANLTDTLL